MKGRRLGRDYTIIATWASLQELRRSFAGPADFKAIGVHMEICAYNIGIIRRLGNLEASN